jgi:hypothetical protein
MLFQGDDVVASTTTDNYGVFEFTQVPDGSYAVTAVGVDGVGLIGIEVVGDKAGADPAIDFTMVSSETVGWLKHYATEVAYRRGLMAPRQPYPEDQISGDFAMEAAYANSCCRSRGVSFQQWLQMGCQCGARKFGDGQIIADFANGVRKNIERVDAVYERAFYSSEFQNYSSGVGPQQFYGPPRF